MPRYSTTWIGYRLPTGQEFFVAVCGYNRKVRNMTLGMDTIRHKLIRHVNVEGQNCDSNHHCLALDCPLNQTPREDIPHMLDMWRDEPVDAETSKLWGTESTAECLVKFAQRMTQSLPKELNQEIEAEQ